MENEDFEIYHNEVLSYLDKSILPQSLFVKIQDDLREYIYVLYYKHVPDTTAATVTAAFLTTFKKYIK